MTVNTKYEFTGDTEQSLGVTLEQIRLLVDIPSLGLTAGTIGGWIEGEKNLQVSGNAQVYGDARVYTVNVTATRTDGYTFLVTPTPEGPRIIAGCRYFTFEEARKHWNKTRGGTNLGDESIAIVEHLETMAKINGFMEKLT